MYSGELEVLALKWAVTERVRDYFYYPPEFVVYSEDNPLAYVLRSAKVHATGMSGWESLLTLFLEYIIDQVR